MCLAALLIAVALVPMASAQSADIYSQPVQAERSRTYDALHYKVSLRFDESTRSFYGSNTITLTPLRDSFSEAVLDAETFTVDEVTGSDGAVLPFVQEPHKVTVHFSEPYAYEDTVVFTVRYHANNVDIDGAAFGMAASYDLGIGFKSATEDNPQLINTLSFPQGARLDAMLRPS